MSKKFPLKFNVFDVIVAIVSLLIAVILIIVNNFTFSNKVDINDRVVYIYYNSIKLEEHTIFFKDLKEDEEVKITLEKENYSLLNEDMVIVVSKKEGIKVEEEESPQKICSKQGWINRVDTPVVCLPNSVYVIIADINDINIDIGLE